MSPACYRDLVEMKYLNMGHKVSMVSKVLSRSISTPKSLISVVWISGRSRGGNSAWGTVTKQPSSQFYLLPLWKCLYPHLSPGNKGQYCRQQNPVCIWRKGCNLCTSPGFTHVISMVGTCERHLIWEKTPEFPSCFSSWRPGSGLFTLKKLIDSVIFF